MSDECINIILQIIIVLRRAVGDRVRRSTDEGTSLCDRPEHDIERLRRGQRRRRWQSTAENAVTPPAALAD